MKIKTKVTKAQRALRADQTSGFLEPAKAEELRAILSDEEHTVAFTRFFAEHSADEFKDHQLGCLVKLITTREAEHAVRLIFKHCESPIERVFFCSCINAFLKNNVIFRFMPPSDNFPEDAE